MSEPAFPAPNFPMSGTHEGMTLRDYFAARAMQSYLKLFHKSYRDDSDLVAKLSYKLADIMLAEREEKAT
jgi:hypothetical protein